MDRSYTLEQNERVRAANLEMQHQQTLAAIGAATLQLDANKTQLPVIEQSQRQLVQDAVMRLGVQNFQAARIEAGNLIVRFADQPTLDAPVEVIPAAKPNGVESRVKE